MVRYNVFINVGSLMKEIKVFLFCIKNYKKNKLVFINFEF